MHVSFHYEHSIWEIRAESGAPPKVRAMLRENVPPVSTKVNFNDIGKVVDAFKTIAYPKNGPCVCPSAITCGQMCGECADGGAPCDSDADCGGAPWSCEPQDSCGNDFVCGRDAYGNDPIMCRDKCKRCD